MSESNITKLDGALPPTKPAALTELRMKAVGGQNTATQNWM